MQKITPSACTSETLAVRFGCVIQLTLPYNICMYIRLYVVIREFPVVTSLARSCSGADDVTCMYDGLHSCNVNAAVRAIKYFEASNSVT